MITYNILRLPKTATVFLFSKFNISPDGFFWLVIRTTGRAKEAGHKGAMPPPPPPTSVDRRVKKKGRGLVYMPLHITYPTSLPVKFDVQKYHFETGSFLILLTVGGGPLHPSTLKKSWLRH